jgi:hypothetical protein
MRKTVKFCRVAVQNYEIQASKKGAAYWAAPFLLA